MSLDAFLSPLDPEVAARVQAMIAEPAADCESCGQPVRRGQSRQLTKSGMCHSDCQAPDEPYHD